MSKINSIERQLLILICQKQTKSSDGWAKVSKEVLPIIKTIQEELIELKTAETGSAVVRLSPIGQTVINYI